MGSGAVLGLWSWWLEPIIWLLVAVGMALHVWHWMEERFFLHGFIAGLSAYGASIVEALFIGRYRENNPGLVRQDFGGLELTSTLVLQMGVVFTLVFAIIVGAMALILGRVGSPHLEEE